MPDGLAAEVEEEAEAEDRELFIDDDDDAGSRGAGFGFEDDEDVGACESLDLLTPLTKSDLASCSWRALMNIKVESCGENSCCEGMVIDLRVWSSA